MNHNVCCLRYRHHHESKCLQAGTDRTRETKLPTYKKIRRPPPLNCGQVWRALSDVLRQKAGEGLVISSGDFLCNDGRFPVQLTARMCFRAPCKLPSDLKSVIAIVLWCAVCLAIGRWKIPAGIQPGNLPVLVEPWCKPHWHRPTRASLVLLSLVIAMGKVCLRHTLLVGSAALLLRRTSEGPGVARSAFWQRCQDRRASPGIGPGSRLASVFDSANSS